MMRLFTFFAYCAETVKGMIYILLEFNSHPCLGVLVGDCTFLMCVYFSVGFGMVVFAVLKVLA